MLVSEAAVLSHYNTKCNLVKFCYCRLMLLDAEDMPRHQPPLPIVTTSGPTVTQPPFGYGHARHRPPADKPGQGGKTVTVKAVCRSDIQGQKGGAGTVCPLFFISCPVLH